MLIPYGDRVFTKVYIKPRTMYPADEDDFWCGHLLEHGETIDTLDFALFVICLEIWRTKVSIPKAIYYEQRH